MMSHMNDYYTNRDSKQQPFSIWCNGVVVATLTGIKRPRFKWLAGYSKKGMDIKQILSQVDLDRRCEEIHDRYKAQKKANAMLINDMGVKFLSKLANNPYIYVNRVSISSVAVSFYPEFNSFTICGDGFPMARFVLSKDLKQVFFMFAGDWKGNDKLQLAANPNCIPHIFPIEDLEKHVAKIAI